MSSFLQNLSNNEAVLLMYLANELPADDRAEVEQMLHNDETLRAQFIELRLLYDSAHAGITSADATAPLPSGFAAARHVGEAIRDRRAGRPSVDDHDSRRRFRWLIYPAAAAALLAIGMVSWWRMATGELTYTVGQPVLVDNYPVASETPGVESRPSLRSAVVVDGRIDQMSEDQLLALFDPVIQSTSLRSQREYNALTYLNETLQ